MADNGDNSAALELSDVELEVLGVLREAGVPLDAIAIASRTRLDVESVLQALETLSSKGRVSRAEPEPVHERFATAGHAG